MMEIKEETSVGITDAAIFQLLLSVAELDATGAIPPTCLEIAQLCGRLPLCLNIVGNLIRTFGEGWEEEVERALLFYFLSEIGFISTVLAYRHGDTHMKNENSCYP